MEYTAALLAALGCMVGAVFRLKVLLAILAFALVGSVFFAIFNRYSFIDTVITLISIQFALQIGYFLGILIRSLVARNRGIRSVL